MSSFSKAFSTSTSLSLSFLSTLPSVHDDVQLCQWLRTRDGRLKLGDFNRAEIMDYDENKKKYCRYENGGVFGTVSSESRMFYLEIKCIALTFVLNVFGESLLAVSRP